MPRVRTKMPLVQLVWGLTRLSFKESSAGGASIWPCRSKGCESPVGSPAWKLMDQGWESGRWSIRSSLCGHPHDARVSSTIPNCSPAGATSWEQPEASREMEEQGAAAVLAGSFLCCLLQVPGVGSLEEPLLEDVTLENISWAAEEAPGNESSEHTFFSLDYQHVQVPFEITLWIMLASLAKIGFHLYNKLPSVVPESCLLIFVGLIMGGIIYGLNDRSPPVMDSDIFFLYLLPPIVLDAGYFMPSRPFFENIGTILLYAVVGTIWNVFGIGFSLYGICQVRAFRLQDVSLLHNLLFGSLIAAVDPVAVLAVFEEIHVNEKLHILVFGESLLNDAVTVVLYKLFRSFCEMPTIKSVDVFAGVGKFFVVGLGGVLVGLSFGFTAAFTTRFTKDIRVIEPLFVFLYSYLSYLTAEMFHLSGIVAIIACAMGMKRYVEANISLKSHTTVKYFMKMWSSVSDTLIFIFLGVSTIGENHEWNWPYICFTVIFCLIWRALGVLVLTFFVNRFHVNTITSKDQFIIAYGGLRGAICFSLVFLLPEFHRKKLFIAATTVVILFTVFVQGMTIRPLVDLLAVKRKRESAPTVGEQIHIRFLDHLLAGIEDISGHWGQYYWKDKLEYFNSKYLQKILLREYDQPKSSIVLLYEKLERKHAIELAEAGQLGHGPAHPSLLSNDRTVRTDQKLEDTQNPDVLDNMQEILARNLYRIRRTGPAYNRHTLPGESEPSEHAKEILILRHKSLLVEVSGSDAGSSRKESQKDDSCSAQGDPTPQPKLCRSFTAYYEYLSDVLSQGNHEHKQSKRIKTSVSGGEHGKGPGREGEPVEVRVCHPPTTARRDLGRGERPEERAESGDLQTPVMLCLPRRI